MKQNRLALLALCLCCILALSACAGAPSISAIERVALALEEEQNERMLLSPLTPEPAPPTLPPELLATQAPEAAQPSAADDAAEQADAEEPAATAEPAEEPAATARPTKKPAATAKPTKKPAATAKPTAKPTQAPVEVPADTPRPVEPTAAPTPAPADTPAPLPTAQEPDPTPAEGLEAELVLAAKVAYLEARGKGEAAYRAVLSVIYNRCKSSRFGGGETSITTEVYRKSQFSVVNGSSFESTEPPAEIVEYARDVFVNGNTNVPAGVLFFRAERLGESWGDKTFYQTIGGNSFFYAD
ncbi:MAG TPA: cell wall hydrolase [Candidatus Aphodomorpha intestinavium]|uniref:Cell wall hydrolase n=1 Tax=Candidatus Aphodomorpha intestinavium TaxID=2840672 RepID=A0A9D1SSW5_9FIRM|nr:cell wall hydrolase [Candidatus Aphodomorpha intestinavium]